MYTSISKTLQLGGRPDLVRFFLIPEPTKHRNRHEEPSCPLLQHTSSVLPLAIANAKLARLPPRVCYSVMGRWTEFFHTVRSVSLGSWELSQSAGFLFCRLKVFLNWSWVCVCIQLFTGKTICSDRPSTILASMKQTRLGYYLPDVGSPQSPKTQLLLVSAIAYPAFLLFPWTLHSEISLCCLGELEAWSSGAVEKWRKQSSFIVFLKPVMFPWGCFWSPSLEPSGLLMTLSSSASIMMWEWWTQLVRVC